MASTFHGPVIQQLKTLFVEADIQQRKINILIATKSTCTLRWKRVENEDMKFFLWSFLWLFLKQKT